MISVSLDEFRARLSRDAHAKDRLQVQVLDHGYLRFIDSLGSDESVIEAARMSTGRGFVSWERYKRCRICEVTDVHGTAESIAARGHQHDWEDFTRGDVGTLTHLYRNTHSGPFEMAELVVEVQAPIMVFREWHRHRTQSYNEMSARYVQMPNLHYVPDGDRFRKQSKTNKQGSGDEIIEAASRVREDIITEQEEIYASYEDYLGEGLAKEVARINTPVSRYSRMRAKANLWNWLRFLNLRLRPNAQWEIRQYAEAVAAIIEHLWPRTYELFEEWDLHALKFSATEIRQLREILRSGGFTASQEKVLTKLFSEGPA